MIKITYTPHILPTSTLEVEHPFHKIKTPCYSWLFSPRLKGHGLLKKGKKWTREGPKYSKKEKKEMWAHEGPMCFKRKLAHVQKKVREK